MRAEQHLEVLTVWRNATSETLPGVSRTAEGKVLLPASCNDSV